MWLLIAGIVFFVFWFWVGVQYYKPLYRSLALLGIVWLFVNTILSALQIWFIPHELVSNSAVLWWVSAFGGFFGFIFYGGSRIPE